MNDNKSTTISISKMLFARFKTARDAAGYTTEGFLSKLLNRKNFEDGMRASLLIWITNYVVEEDFEEKHLSAIVKIINLFNECRESEKEIFEFADNLYKKYRE